ncbi:unnamed protein product [Echinostoma caproni]|uniref:CUB domain-containing protein n=1 Tax=Echinostoma caproni TaxID=27848 RepID=A0A183B3H3_9TREM|nr:unnamed protein product [Echinostoma caproni]
MACAWDLKGSAGKKILVSLTATSAETKGQCITVYNKDAADNTAAKKICVEEGNNKFTGDLGKDVTVEFEGPTEPDKSIKNFEVYYQLEDENTDTVNPAECNVIPGPPTNQDQSFTVAKSGDTIPAGLTCTWNIQTTGGKNIRVSLNVDSTKTENQCVAVANVDKTGAQIICGKEQNNTFTSGGQGVVIVYPGSRTANTQQSNFKIHYQFDVAAKSMLSTMILIVCVSFGMYDREW